ncbi:butyrophilin-like protein 10 [Alosa pseudoharengus]|uniref:butyrophilin-like protein 10 n=1 Tax=Alosa pseudoharengus TaxID=34774 RepID=UPI003F8A8B7E
MNAENMTVRWRRLERPDQSSFVHLYQDGRDQHDKQIQSYKGRTSLFKDELQKGNASLKLSSVQVSDEGDYKCIIVSGTHYEAVLVQVNVRGIGKGPRITLEGTRKDGGISLVCESNRWWPEPVLEWLDDQGRLLTAQQLETNLGPNGFRLKQQLVAYLSQTNPYVCRLTQNGIGPVFKSKVVKEATLYISVEILTATAGKKSLTVITNMFVMARSA